jgi:hypothetical protein
MAKPNQPEPNVGIDRRQLLASAAAVTAARITPEPEQDRPAPLLKASNVTTAPVSDAPGLNILPGTARRIRQIVQRNEIRKAAGLPLLSIPTELRKMKEAERAAEFEKFAAVHWEAIWEEVLAPIREARGEPCWQPTRFMEGLALQAQVSRLLRERFA